MQKLKYGNTNTYFINGLLFDTDMPGMMQQFFRTIKQNDIPFMSGARYDAKAINEIASFINKTYKEGKGKKEIYTWLIQKYKRTKGLEMYNIHK